MEYLCARSDDNIDDGNTCIPVYLRIKGGNTSYNTKDIYQITGQTLSCKIPEGSHSFRNIKSGDQLVRSYTFTHIFNSDTTQLELFNGLVKPKILHFLNGNNYTLFTYGTTGSGKTFTIVGTSDEPGIIPRTLEYLFKTMAQLPDKPCVILSPNGEIEILTEAKKRCLMENKSTILTATQLEKSTQIKTYRLMEQRLSSEPVAEIEYLPNISISVWVSFAEIYNEHIYDLLKPLAKNSVRPKLRLGSHKDDVYIKDLTLVPITNGLEAYQIHQYGIHNLNYAATELNSHSSRSHSIFTVKLVQTSLISGDSCVSYLRFCDLAGSERSKKTLNTGVRLMESNNLNKSLLVLGRCMEIIRSYQQVKDQQLVPFRESKLTHLCQKALMGQENIALILNLNPSASMFEESQHALNFSAITKDVAIIEKPELIKRRASIVPSAIESEGRASIVPSAIESVDEDPQMLRDLIMKLHNEIEHQREQHENEIMEEKATVAELYKKHIKELKELHQMEIERKLATKEKYYENQIDKLKDYYKRRLFEASERTDVITISDNSEEESFSDNDIKMEIEKLQKEVQDWKERTSSLEEEINILKEEKRDYMKEKQKIEDNFNSRFARAEQEYEDLLQKYDSLKSENNDLVLNNIELIEKNEDLNILSMCAYTSDLSEEETDVKPLVNDVPMDKDGNI